jgi:DNA polymerase-3 subunit beta
LNPQDREDKAMEFTARKEVLLQALTRALGITEKKSTVPMVSAVLLEAEKPGKLRVSATDLEVALVGEYPVEVGATGRVAVAARQIADIVRSLPTDEAAVRRRDNSWLEIVSGRAEFKLVGMAPEEFPAIPSTLGVPLSSLSVETLRLLVERTLFSVSTDETRYNLMGVYVEPRDGLLRFVSSDGHRLSLADRPLQDGEQVPLRAGVLIPKKGLSEARRIVEGEGGSCEIGLKENTFVFRYGDVTLVMRPIEAKFPDYELVVPKEAKRVVRLQRGPFMDALRRVSILAADKANTVKLLFAPGKLELSATTPQLGEAREEIEADLTGEELRIGFNARYLVDALTVIPGDVVRFELGDEASPGVLKPDGQDGFLGVIMPIRI